MSGPGESVFEDPEEDTLPHLLCCLDLAPFLRATPSPHVFISKQKVRVRGDYLELFSLYAKQYNPEVVCLGYPPTGYYFVYPNDYHPSGEDGHAQTWPLSQTLQDLLMGKFELKSKEETGIKAVSARTRTPKIVCSICQILIKSKIINKSKILCLLPIRRFLWNDSKL